MKLCFKILLCFYVVLSLGFSDASNDSLILDRNVHDEVNGLLSGGSVTANQKDKDVELSGSGPINLTLDNGELVFKVCESCMGKATVCYESEIGLSDPKAAGTCFESSCKVEIEGKTDEITFGGIPFYKGCITSTMNYKLAEVKSSDKSWDIKSCMPKIVDKMVKLFVNIEDGCSVTVTNAKIHAPPATTTTSPTKVPPPTQSSQKGSTEASSFPDWGYAVIGIAILIVILFIGFVVYYLYRKRQTSKRIPPNVDQKQPKSTKAKDATIETSTKKDEDLEAAKAEPKKREKKEKKTKTIEPTATEDIPAAAKIEPKKSQKKEKKATPEPTTTEDIPAPTAKENLEAAKIQPKKIQKKEKKTTQEQTAEDIPAPIVKQPERAPTKQLPPPNPAACYPVVKRLIPRGMKSAKTDSLDETLKKDKTAMAESFVVSAGKLCLKSDETDVLRKMETAYPQNIQHVVLPSEVNLLCMPVSKMFEKMDSMAQVSELKLSSAGCEFDDRGCIVSVSDEARQHLKAEMTDATTVYFAFGAEYPEYITDGPGILNEASIPLLYVIALQTRFSEKSRRKACAILRRKLVRVLGYFKAADRAKMPFPVNIVEAAYCKDPKYFFDPTAIKTDSGSDGKRKNKSPKKH